ncbi:epidermal growth factor receptor-like [Haliotis asinina]|uniref:epidermal growth factor receptor-like n=1 Tax=Haliotis asinina TaxID=109174 RepID=UPI0035322C20
MIQVLILCAWCVCTALGVFIQPDIDLPNLTLDKACPGTHMGFSYSGSLRRHFRYMQRRYTGCTYVQGNLEITHLRHKNINYDLSFLSTIRYVSGYVLIGLVTRVREIPLTSLEVIRGNQTLELFGRQFGLAVTLTSRSYGSRKGLQELQLPKLREISRGDVLFANNPVLCYVKTILWEAIISGGRKAMLKGDQPLAKRCLPCSSHCDQGGTRRCWGRGKQLCQKVEPFTCDPSCPYRCFGPGKQGCCHSQCAAGCWDDTEADCEMCKNYNYLGRCVGYCPYDPNTYAFGSMCLKF